jgi:RinA family phage transcriptional activator
LKLGKNDIPKLEEYWRNYAQIERQKRFREFELLYQSKEEPTGGGRSNTISKPTEQQVIKLSKDELYNNLSNIVDAIDSIYKQANEEERFIIHCRYLDDNVEVYEWEDIAHELTKQRTDDKVISRNAVLRRRNKIMQQTAKEIGWVSII